MAKSTSLNIPQEINNPAVSILPADTTTWKTVYTADADGALVKMLGATSTDSAAMNVQLGVYDGVSTFVIGTVPVAANAGTNGSALSVDLLDTNFIPQLTIDSNGKTFLQLKGGYILKAKVLVTVTSAKQIDIVGCVEEY